MNARAGGAGVSEPASEPSVSVCVCTRNRPSELRDCLASIASSRFPVHEVIVSDDSDDSLPAQSVCAEFANARHVRGPRRGLCANRNTAISEATGTHILFLDDDAQLGDDFLTLVTGSLADLPPGERANTIVSGCERRPNGHVTAAREQSFLGFQRREYRPGDDRSTVVINAALFPAALFARTGFDERLRYGYDEVDLTTRAVALGYRIEPLPGAVNLHNHSPVNRAEYSGVTDASRLYVTLKRRLVTERRRPAALAFAIVAPAHLVAAAVKQRGLAGVPRAFATLRAATLHIRSGIGRQPAPPLAS